MKRISDHKYTIFSITIVVIHIFLYFCTENQIIIIMKRLATIMKFAVFALVLTMMGCKDDNKNDSTSGSGGGGVVIGNHLTRITEVSKFYRDGTLYATENIEYQFRWNGGHVSQGSSYWNGEMQSIAYLSYENDRLVRADVTYTGKNDLTALFYYDGQNITRVAIQNGSSNYDITMSYSNGKLSQIVSPTLTFNLNWTGDDITRVNLVGDRTRIFTYDTKLNPVDQQAAIVMCLFEENFEDLSKHNVKSLQEIPNSSSSVDYMEFAYIYDASGRYPVSRSFTKTFGGNSHERCMGKTDYVYGD